MRISWSGLGFLYFPYFVVAVFGSFAVAGAVTKNPPLAALVIAGVLVVAAVVGSLFGAMLNGGSGRHSFMGLDVELSGIPLVVFAWIAVAVSAGLATSKGIGWLVFFSPLIALIVVPFTQARRAMRRGLDSRPALATARGWKYQSRMPELSTRYSDSPDKTAAKGAYGVLFGEVDGVRFTAWDTMRDEGRWTSWALHLPADFDAVQHGPAGLTSANPALSAYLWTAPVAATTRDLALDGWFLHHTDLVLSRRVPQNPGYFTADELAAGAAALLRLVHAFPPDLPTRFGRAIDQSTPARS